MSSTYFAEDGSYGDANGLIVLTTDLWTDSDWSEFESDPMPEIAQRITIYRRKEVAKLLREALRRCACVCGCDYKLDGYAPGETVCGACFDNCDMVTP